MFTSIAAITFLLSAPTVSTNGKPRVKLIPSGENIVFKMNTNGVVVTGTYDIHTEKGIINPQKDYDVKKGDIIVKANNRIVSELSDLTSEINKTDQLKLQINRSNQLIERTLNIQTSDNIKKSGLFVKDRVLGVGTITYIDPNNNYYGALGHEVVDNDTKRNVNLKNGEIYQNDVISVSKGTNQHPGEKISKTELKNQIGTIITNTNKGMFGKYYQDTSKLKKYEIGYANEIKKDKAYLLTCIRGNQIKPYEIKITEVKKQEITDTKSFTFKITDKELISQTGGVFSGMSGSPIIQDNRLIGAVTHVMLDKIEYGYGLFIENMYHQELNSIGE